MGASSVSPSKRRKKDLPSCSEAAGQHPKLEKIMATGQVLGGITMVSKSPKYGYSPSKMV